MDAQDVGSRCVLDVQLVTWARKDNVWVVVVGRRTGLVMMDGWFRIKVLVDVVHMVGGLHIVTEI